jgi:hypothetical protein
MEAGILIFALMLIGVGVFFVFKYMPSRADRAADEEFPREDANARHQALQEANRIRRRRSQVWWKVENMYSELRQRTSVDEIATTDPSVSSRIRDRGQTDLCDQLTSSEVNEAFEAFLRLTK